MTSFSDREISFSRLTQERIDDSIQLNENKKIGQQVNNLAHPYNQRVSQTSAVVKRSDRENFNKDALESERGILELESQIADIEEELSDDIFL